MDCAEMITSNDYASYIINYYEPGEEILSQARTQCWQNLGPRFSALYIDRSFIDTNTVPVYSYMSIPKLYSLMSTQPLEAAGVLRLQQQPNLMLKGQGVLTCIIDSGIDYTHKAFRYNDGSSRILRIWDQTTNEGNRPNEMKYGTEYTKEEIDEALKRDDPLELVPTNDPLEHGTYVAGVAAGSEDLDNGFTGVASESMLVVVKLKEAKNYLKDFYCLSQDITAFQEDDIMAGVRYCRMIAIQYDIPSVIIIALGSNMGGHNGITPLADQLNTSANMAQNAVVITTGNEADARHHYQNTVTVVDNFKDMEINVNEGLTGFMLEIWGNAPDVFTVSITSPYGEVIPRLPINVARNTEYTFLLDDTRAYIDYRLIETLSGDELILVRVKSPTAGIWRVRVYGNEVFSGTFNAWLPNREFVGENVYFLDSNPTITLSEPSASSLPISVGSYNSFNNSIYIPSGRGFTRRGSIKPDICAPAVNVTGPLASSRYEYAGGYIVANDNYVDRSGGSASCAILGGIAAQFLTWGIVEGYDKNIKTNEIKSYIIKGAVRDSSLQYPNEQWGYGIVNAYEALLTQTRN